MKPNPYKTPRTPFQSWFLAGWRRSRVFVFGLVIVAANADVVSAETSVAESARLFPGCRRPWFLLVCLVIWTLSALCVHRQMEESTTHRMKASPKATRWLRFSLRGLFLWVVAVSAYLACGPLTKSQGVKDVQKWILENGSNNSHPEYLAPLILVNSSDTYDGNKPTKSTVCGFSVMWLKHRFIARAQG